MPWTIQISYGDKHAERAGLAGWPEVREKVMAALKQFVPEGAMRDLLAARVDTSDAARNQFFALASADWRIIAQVEINMREPWAAGTPITE